MDERGIYEARMKLKKTGMIFKEIIGKPAVITSTVFFNRTFDVARNGIRTTSY